MYVCMIGMYVLGALSHEAKFKQDVKTRSKHSGEDVICGMGGLIRTQYVCTYIRDVCVNMCVSVCLHV